MDNKKYKVLMTCSESFYNAYTDIEEDIHNIGVDFQKILSEKPIPTNELKKYIEDIDIYLVAVESVNREIIDSAKNLKYILKHGVGVDNINVSYAKEKGILVTNVPGQNSDAVADMAMALMLNSARFVTHGDNIVKNGGWKLLIGHELTGKSLGVLGFGMIGRKVSERAAGFGMRILAYDVVTDALYAKQHNIEYVSKDELFTRSDFITICTALNEDTRYMVNRETLKIMKNTAYLINTARGSIVQEEDLADALNNGCIAGAALDVYETEPPSRALIQAKNIITTPHIAGSTFECAEKLSKIAVSNISKYISGQMPDYIV